MIQLIIIEGGAAHVSTTNKSEDISNIKMLPNFTIEYACINKCSTSGDCSCFCEGAVRLTSLYVSSNIEMATTPWYSFAFLIDKTKPIDIESKLKEKNNLQKLTHEGGRNGCRTHIISALKREVGSSSQL